MHRYLHKHGFTLVEILVGLLLFGVSSVAVISLITNSGKSSKEVLAVSSQNSQLGAAMQIIQTELSDANKPLLEVGTDLSTNPPKGSSISFTRVEQDEDGNDVYFAERIAYRDSSGRVVGVAEENQDEEANFANTITIEIARSSTEFASADAALEAINAAPPKALVNKVVAPTADLPLFSYFKNANTPVDGSDSQWKDQIQLADIILRRDEDGAGGESPEARLQTSVLLKNLAEQIQDGDAVGC